MSVNELLTLQSSSQEFGEEEGGALRGQRQEGKGCKTNVPNGPSGRPAMSGCESLAVDG